MSDNRNLTQRFRDERQARVEEYRQSLTGDGTVAPSDDFDPADHHVDEVLAYVSQHPDQFDRVVAAERSGKARVSILNHRPEGEAHK